jgi:hypothetical protein
MPMPGIISRTEASALGSNKTPPEISSPAGFFLAAAARQQRPPCMAFSVQFAAEPTSDAAPRTVLHAAIARHAPTNATATSFWTIIAPPLDVRNDNESPKQLYVH